jgi:hypothetical protein
MLQYNTLHLQNLLAHLSTPQVEAELGVASRVQARAKYFRIFLFII